VVWDIGANVGLFSFAAASQAGRDGRVLAIEPDVWLASLLQRSSALVHDRAPVDVLAVAVCDTNSLEEFVIARRARSANYLISAGQGGGRPLGKQTGGWRAKQLVPTVTLDWLLDHYAALRGLLPVSIRHPPRLPRR
jgi:FkbM family methyltransferase